MSHDKRSKEYISPGRRYFASQGKFENGTTDDKAEDFPERLAHSFFVRKRKQPGFELEFSFKESPKVQIGRIVLHKGNSFLNIFLFILAIIIFSSVICLGSLIGFYLGLLLKF